MKVPIPIAKAKTTKSTAIKRVEEKNDMILSMIRNSKIVKLVQKYLKLQYFSAFLKKYTSKPYYYKNVIIKNYIFAEINFNKHQIVQKIFTAVALMLFLPAFSQADCTSILETKTYSDGSVMTSVKDRLKIPNNTGSGITVDMISSDKSLIVSFGTLAKEPECIGPKAKLYIYFTDGEKLKLEHMGKLDCKGNLSLYFAQAFNNLNELELLKTKNIKTIGIQYSKVVDKEIKFNTKDFELSSEQSETFRKSLTCLSNNRK